MSEENGGDRMAALRRMRAMLNHLSESTNSSGGTVMVANCAAIGATKDGAELAAAVGASQDSDDPYAIELDFVDLDGIEEIPLVGSDVDLSEDYVAGLNMMAQRVHPETQLGYVDTIESGHVLMVVKPASVKRVLMSSVQHFLGGLRPPSAAFFGHKVLFILEGKEWLDLRNVLKKAFQKQNVRLMSQDLNWAANGFKGILDHYVESGKDVDFMRLIGAYHIDGIGKVSFDYDLGALGTWSDGEHVVSQSFEYLLEELPRRAYAPDWETQNDFESDTPDNRAMAEMSWQVRDVIRQVITRRLEDINNGVKPRPDLLQKMIDVYVEDYPEAAGDVEALTAELGDNLVEIIFAGFNTAVPTTCHCLYFLCKHPEYYQRVKDEIREVIGDREPTTEDLKKLKFTERCFMEALRLCPPASLVARQITKEIELDGMIIPRATRVWLPACAIHRNPTAWENPNAFNPDRFLNKPVRGAFIPFSDGPRSCAGRNYALHESILCIASIFGSGYDLSIANDYDWTTIFTGFGLRPFDFNTARVCMRFNVTKS